MTTAPNVTVIPARPQTAENRQYHQLRVAAYCRVSTEQEEQQNSYQVQIAYYSDLINKNREWTLAGIFADEGISGTQTKKRTEFNRMIRMCKRKKIDLVITKSISRFARNTVDCLEYVRQLKDLGIGVIFEKENINTLTMTSEFMIALYGSFAQAESESISKNVSWGVEKAFREGRVRYQYKYWLGYRKGVDGKPEIVPEEAEIVRLIFTLFLDGHSLQTIAEVLENRHFTSDKIAKWHREAVKRILENEKYSGDCLLQKTYTADCITHKQVKNNGERAMFLVTDCHEAIIDRDTFNLAQQELARRKSKRKISDRTTTEQGKYSSKFALSELMICGECGTPYRRCTWNVHGRKRIVWRCISRLDHGSRYCQNSPTIHEEPLHRAIVGAVNEYYDCNEELRNLLKNTVKSSLLASDQKEMQAIEKRLIEIDNTRNFHISLIANGGADEDALDAEFAKLYAEEQGLNERLMALKSQSQADAKVQKQAETALQKIEQTQFVLTEFDDILIRKVLECVKVLTKTELLVIFKGGQEVRVQIEK